MFDTVKKHCNLIFKSWSYLRLSTDQYDQLSSMEKKNPRPTVPHIWVLLGLAAFTSPESVQKQHKNIGEGNFSHYRVNSSCEQVVATHWPSLHMQCSMKPLTVVTISALQRLANLTLLFYFFYLKAQLSPNVEVNRWRLLDQC